MKHHLLADLLRARHRGRRAAWALAAFSMLGCYEVETGPPHHLILITIDTLRADPLGCCGYFRDTTPNLDRLAERGVLFEQAFAQWPKTGTSFASMFTGRYPSSTGLTHLAAQHIPESYETLPGTLSKLGFHTVAVVSNPVLNRELGWQRGFDEYSTTWGSAESAEVSPDPLVLRQSINALRVNELASPLLARRRDDSHLFAWVHCSDPHAPYLLPSGVENPYLIGPEGEEEIGAELIPDDVPSYALIEDRREVGFYTSQYDANIHLVDRAIGELLRAAEELGILDDALIVVTADHGESLAAIPAPYLGEELLQER